MLQCLVTFVPLEIELAEVHVAVGCLDVVGPEDFHAAEKATFIKIHRFLHLPLWHKQVSHDTINGHMEWVTWP